MQVDAGHLFNGNPQQFDAFGVVDGRLEGLQTRTATVV